MKSYYKDYCRNLLETHNLQKDRIITNKSGDVWFQDLMLVEDNENVKKHIIKNFTSVITDSHLYKQVTDDDIILRFNSNDKYNLNWHQDNKILQKHHKKNKDKIYNLDIIKEDDNYIFGIWSQKKAPEKTILIYLSTHGEDFFGAELQFLTPIEDEYITVNPKKGDIISFDGREMHRVTQLHKGDRKCIVIKLYT